MKLGLLVEAEEGLDWEHWRGVYRTAECLGFESVWLSDHLESPWSPERHGLETWTALAVAAAETTRVSLGPLVSPVTFRPASIIARMTESLSHLSGERFVLGLGLGWNASEHATAGIAFPPIPERTQLLADAIARIKCVLGERQAPLLIGGKGPRSTLPMVARHADEWNITTSSVVEYQVASAELDRQCQKIARDPREIRRSVAMGVLIGRDAAELRARADRMRTFVPPLAEEPDPVDAARKMAWVVGTPDDIAAHLRAFDVDRVILGYYDVADREALELIASDVLPRVA